MLFEIDVDMMEENTNDEELHDTECEKDDWFKSSNFEYTEVEDKR